MSSRINLRDHGLEVSGQPDEAGLRRWAEAGVRTVMNLRHAGEFAEGEVDADGAGGLDIAGEGERVGALGMDYVHLPVSMKPTEDGGADERLATAFETLLTAARESGPVAVHCKLGQRAGAMVLIALARHQRWAGDRALAEADRLGLGGVAESPKLREYVRRCVEVRGPGGC